MENFNFEEAFKYCLESGMIDIKNLHEQLAIAKRLEYLNKHKWAISQGKDGYWRSYIPDAVKSRKMIKKSSKKDVEDAVVEYYKLTEQNLLENENYCFKIRFEEWVRYQKSCERTDNTIYKYQTDYNRFFRNRKIEKLDIRQINEAIIMSSLKEVLLEKEIPYRALKTALKYLDNVFEKSIRDKLIEQNPCRYVELQYLKKYCTSKSDNIAKKRTISADERDKIMKKIKNSSNPAKFAVEFAFCTGMRVGELAALKWSDIDYEKREICICRSEKYNRLTGEFFFSTTKNDKIRHIPLTVAMQDILRRTKKWALKAGCLGTFVFMNQNGNIHGRVISDWLRNTTTTKDFEHAASIHGIRRTFNSIMREDGVSAETAASLLGHTADVNNNNYTYSMSEMKKKEEILAVTTKKILNF